MTKRASGRIFAAAMILAAVFFSSAARAADRNVSVFAAASLADAMKLIGADFTKKTGVTITVNAAASSALAKQIESGAPAGVFISASTEWMDYLAKKNLLEGEPVNVAGNSLVLIAPADTNLTTMTLQKGFDFPGAFKGRLAVGDPKGVPAGVYAKEALTHFGWWAALEPRLLPCPDVRAALSAVGRGEVELGVVYATDARVANAGGKNSVKIVGVFPEDSHKPVVYPAALIRDAKGAAAPPDTKTFFEFLSGPEARADFEKLGFLPAQ